MFTRRYSTLPTAAELLKTSGVVIVDAPPPVPANAAPFGKICVIGEFEDGPFDTPTDLLTSADQPNIFGGFGYRYGSKKYAYACALRSGGMEPWNGNGWLQTARLRFGALCFVRVDSSIGQIALTPRAFVQSSLKGPFSLSPGLTFSFTPDDSSTVTITFAAAAATHTGSSGAFAPNDGDVLALSVDDGSIFQVILQATDTSASAVANRINQAYGQTIASSDSGELKLTSIKKGTASHITIVASATASALGLTPGTYNGSGDAADIALMSTAELKAKVEGASAAVSLTLSPTGSPRLVSKQGGAGSIVIESGTANAQLGFSNGQSATAALSQDVIIPAGSRASSGTDSTRVVTMQTTKVPRGSTNTVLLKVRPAVDDGSYIGAAIGAINTLEDAPGGVEWSIGNPVALSAALTASQLDSQYLSAIDATIGVGNDTTKRINGLVSARQSNAIRARLKGNAVDTSANGHFGRRAFLSPPNGTSAQTAMGAAAPGVGAYRAEEVTYAAGGVKCFLQELVDGDYADDGQTIRHPDAILASRWSVLTPGYNPGQYPEEPQYRFDTTTFGGLEASAATWDIDTYAALKVAGVCGSEFDKDTGVGFEQGVTAVDPATDPSRVDISRKTLADFIGDSLSGIGKVQSKRQGTTQRREAMRASIQGFLDKLVGDTVESYTVTLADAASQPQHVARWDIAVSPVQSDDVIVFNLSVGPNAVELSRG